jgi:hypothetical protein
MASLPHRPDHKGSTWSYRPGFGNPANLVPSGGERALGSGGRIRPDKSGARRNLTSLSHMDYEELGARPAATNVASAMTIADVSPRLALQRLLMLYENADHREAAAFLRRLSPSTFKTLLPMVSLEGGI